MKSQRFYVIKKPQFNVASNVLFDELNEQFPNLKATKICLYNIYDVFDASENELEILASNIIADAITDECLKNVNPTTSFIAYEYLPGQFDARANAATECLQLLCLESIAKIRSGTLVVFDKTINENVLEQIKKYLINQVDSREKILEVLNNKADISIDEVLVHNGFITLNAEGLNAFLQTQQLAMKIEDLHFVQEYFKQEEQREPTDTEIKILDTYWSDHCRHSTFETILEKIYIEKDGTNEVQNEIEKMLKCYETFRSKVHKTPKPMSLMDMATITAKYLKQQGGLQRVEISDEINACSVEVDVYDDGKKVACLLQFKNETHNHPTEIEPYGGASTCLGGAIRDPLSGRSYVYQAMRISGAANIKESISQTMINKLPQRLISKKAADGFSSYGNQIGLATTFVKEIFHDGYKAKRMEVGMVLGVVPKHWVRREKPMPNDVIVLIGGKTGRDGIGGATGSSKAHQENSLTKSSAEVQKGNAPIERKLQRFFKNEEVCKLIKKANDFGAGGVCVAVGELADGLEIFLDKVPLKYEGLNATEIAISESQERMAVVIEASQLQHFISLAQAENLEASHIANVNDSDRLVIKHKQKSFVNLSRTFINTAGIRQKQSVTISKEHEALPTMLNNEYVSKESIIQQLQHKNIASLQGMTEMFDASIGASTVLMPFGGKYQLSPAEASVQIIPVGKNATNCSVVGFGFNAILSSHNPFLGGAYSVIQSLCQLVAVGASYKNAYLSFQEYFKRLEKDPENWGAPVAALLGAMQAQLEFNVAAIGGKDSMSGSFKELHVPPTLISFAVQTEELTHIISSELKAANHFIYIVNHTCNKNLLPNYTALINNFENLEREIKNKNVVSCSTIKDGGIIAEICKMSFGNKIGVSINTTENVFEHKFASFIVAAQNVITHDNFILLGKSNASTNISINNISINIDEAIVAWQQPYKNIFPIIAKETSATNKTLPIYANKKTFEPNRSIQKIASPKVLIPIFPGTNCEYDTAKAFEKVGAVIEFFVFNNLTQQNIKDSINGLCKKINNAQILALSGGFSASDEPDGSGKFIANVLNNVNVEAAINKFLRSDGLILGICNGFQALIKAGLLPFGMQKEKMDITLFKNDINRHVSKIVRTKIVSNGSPWLSNFKVGDIHHVPISNGEGRIVCDANAYKSLMQNGQIASQYVDEKDQASMHPMYNLNGSDFAIEGLLSPCGQIFGKMGHSERYADGLFKNIPNITHQNIFLNAVEYFK